MVASFRLELLCFLELRGKEKRLGGGGGVWKDGALQRLVVAVSRGERDGDR